MWNREEEMGKSARNPLYNSDENCQIINKPVNKDFLSAHFSAKIYLVYLREEAT